MMQPQQNSKPQNMMGLGIGMGAGIGAALMVSTGSAVWLPLCIALGCAFGAVLNSRRSQ